MKDLQSIPEENKLTITFRVEDGCLGPQGESHVDSFCRYAQQKFEHSEPTFIRWLFVHRSDLSQAEVEYQIGHKHLTREYADKYLHVFDNTLDQIETQLFDQVTTLIEQYRLENNTL